MECINDLSTMPWLIKLVQDVGVLIKDNFYIQTKSVQYKLSSSDLLTDTDVAVEQLLIEKIKQRYPTHNFLCEESSKKKDILTDNPTWVIDPVDGTMNFVHTLPFVAVSIGFCFQKIIYLGIIYNPIMRETFYAIRGKGAWLLSDSINGTTPIPERLHVSPNRLLSESVIATGFSASLLRKGEENQTSHQLSEEQLGKLVELKKIVFHNVTTLITHCRDLRRLGSCACEMAFVAAGRLDGVAELNVKEWDIAAGVLLVTEAGGAVINYDGTDPIDIGKRQMIAASSKKLCEELSTIIQRPLFNLHDFDS